MKLENFIFEKRGVVGLLQINRPKVHNALSVAVLDEFSNALEQIHGMKELRALILTGAGEKAFIAGADISEMSKMSAVQGYDFARKGQKVTQQLETLEIPVIAAVNGFALGGGSEMAIACDFILASNTAVFGQPEVCLGLITGFGGAVRLAEFVGWPMARELIYTGRRIDASEAYRIGLVNRVVEPSQLLSEAFKVAEEVAANSPLAVGKIKSAMLKIRSETALSGKLDIEARAFSTMFTTFDQKEGTGAFLEKRKAQFRGK